MYVWVGALYVVNLMGFGIVYILHTVIPSAASLLWPTLFLPSFYKLTSSISRNRVSHVRSLYTAVDLHNWLEQKSPSFDSMGSLEGQ